MDVITDAMSKDYQLERIKKRLLKLPSYFYSL